MFSESSPQRTDIADDEITDTDDSGSTDAADSTILSILSEKTLPTHAELKRWNRIQPGEIPDFYERIRGFREIKIPIPMLSLR